MSLVARHLEANGLPTLVIGSAMDIVKYCGVPRYLHVDFPLGNPCGKPFDGKMQLEIAQSAISFFGEVKIENTVKRLPYRWSDDDSWRDAYARVDETNREYLKQLGDERRSQQAQLKQVNDLARIDF